MGMESATIMKPTHRRQCRECAELLYHSHMANCSFVGTVIDSECHDVVVESEPAAPPPVGFSWTPRHCYKCQAPEKTPHSLSCNFVGDVLPGQCVNEEPPVGSPASPPATCAHAKEQIVGDNWVCCQCHKTLRKVDYVNQPPHYTYMQEMYQPGRVIRVWGLTFNIGTTVKYLSRAGRKIYAGMTQRQSHIQDLKKARWYLDDEIKFLEEEEKKS